MKYAKIICGALQVPLNYPCRIEYEGKTVINPTEELYLQAGYLPLEETEPDDIEGKIAIARYEISNDNSKIIQSWTYEDEPEQETIPES